MVNIADLCVETSEGRGKNSIEEILEFAEKLGIGFLGICDREDSIKDMDRYLKKIEKVDSKTDVRVLKGIKISTSKVKELNDKISGLRDKVEILVVEGNGYRINRKASEDSRIDILLNPEKGRKDPGIDHVLSKKMEKNQVMLGIGWRKLLRTKGKKRAQILSQIRRQLRLHEKFSFGICIVSNSRDKMEMRKPLDMTGLGVILGLDEEKSIKMVSRNPMNIVERSEKVLSDNFVMPGVEVVDDES